MRTVVACFLVLVLAGGAQAQDLRLKVVDVESGKPIAGGTVERWASQWQPRILMPPAKFWFREEKAATDVDGRAAINKVAGDDWYAIKAMGYEEGMVERKQGKYRFTPRMGDKPRELIVKSGVVVVPLRRSSPKPEDRK